MYFILNNIGIGIKFIHCLLFGALISPTDPISVLGILKQAGAPKTLERLEQISKERHAQRKAEAEEEEEEEEDKLVIHSNTELNLDKIDIHDLDKKLNMKPDPVLDDIEILT